MKTPHAIRVAKMLSSRLSHLGHLSYLSLFCCLLPGQLPALDLDPVLRGSSPPSPPGTAMAMAIQNGYAFVALGTNGLAIIDVSNPANPRRVGGFDTSGFASGVAVSGNYAFVADGDAGLQVIDVSNPAN